MQFQRIITKFSKLCVIIVNNSVVLSCEACEAIQCDTQTQTRLHKIAIDNLNFSELHGLLRAIINNKHI